MTEDHDKPNGTDIEGPGIQLRRARERRGLLLHDVAQELHLDEWMLQALEEDDFSALGAPVFAKGHMRKYGDMLGLDGDDLMIAYYRKRGRDDSPPPITMMIAPESPRRARQWRRLGLPLVVLALVIVVLLIFVTLNRGGGPQSPAQAVSSSQSVAGIRERTAEPVLSSQADTASRDRMPGFTEVTTIELPAATTGALTGDDSSALQEITGVPADTRPAADEESAAATGAAAAVGIADLSAQARPADAPETGPMRLRLTLTGESWVEVTDSDGDRLIYAILSAGRSRTVSGDPPIEVFLGLSSAVEVEVNGKPFPIPRNAIRGNTARFVIDRDSP